MGKQDAGRVRQPKLVTRSLILERAHEMYVRGELVQGDERLSLVLESLGYTTGAGYQIWPNQAAFRRDLQVFIAEHLDYDTLVVAFAEVVGRASDDGAEQTVVALGDRLARLLQEHRDFYLALRFLALGSECPAEVTAYLADGRSRLEEALAMAFEQLAASRSDELSRISPDHLAVTVLALIEGFALRARITQDPESGRPELSSALLGLFGLPVNTPAGV